MCLPVAVYYEPWNKGKPPKMPLKPSEKLAAAFPYLCFILVVMGMSSAIYHETQAVPVVEDLSYYQTGPYHMWRYVDPANNEIINLQTANAGDFGIKSPFVTAEAANG